MPIISRSLIEQSIKYHKQHKVWIDDWLKNQMLFSNYVHKDEDNYTKLSKDIDKQIKLL